jgi:hypothetical protein
MFRPGIDPGPPAWEASTLEKSHLDSLFAGYSEPLLGLRWRSARGLYMAPPSACVGMDLTGCGRIAPLHIAMRASALSVYQCPCDTDHVGVTTIEDHDQGHLYTNLEVPRLTCPGRGSIPGLPRGKQAL